VHELVPLITGVSKDDKGFTAAYMEVKRIIATIQKSLGAVGKVTIGSFQKNGFVAVTKAFYHTGQYREIYEKIRKGMKLTPDEVETLIQLYKESLDLDPPSEENEKLKSMVQCIEAFIDLEYEIYSQVQRDLMKIEKLENHEMELLFLKQYKSILDEALSEWRQSINILLHQISILRDLKMLAMEQGFDLKELDNYDTEKISRLIAQLIIRRNFRGNGHQPFG
jgi:tetratricopeptide (TPR) repeat protein